MTIVVYNVVHNSTHHAPGMLFTALGWPSYKRIKDLLLNIIKQTVVVRKMKQSPFFALLILSAVAIEVQPVEIKNFFKGAATSILQGVATVDGIASSDSDDTRELADTLADVLEEDCQSVCPPVMGGDLGARVIQCVQCIAEEFGTVMFPEFLEAVLAIRSPELLQDEEQQHEEVEKKADIKGSENEDAPEIHDSLGLDEIMVESNNDHFIEELTDAFETKGVSLFKALLGDCRDDCASVTVPYSNPVPCLRCMSAYAAKENDQLSFVSGALALFNDNDN